MKTLRKPRLIVISLLVLAVLVGPELRVARAADPPAREPRREWKDRTGTHTRLASYVRMRGDVVLLRLDDGRIGTVPLDALCEADRKYIKEVQAKLAEEAARKKGPQYSDATTVTFRSGLEVTSQGGPCKNLLLSFPIPMDWPEQKVTIVKEDLSPLVRKLPTKTLNGTVKQYQFRVPRLPAGATAHAILTFKLERRHILPPPDPDVFVVPSPIDANLRPYISESPLIEIRHKTVIDAANDLELDPAYSAWQQIETIYDWTRGSVRSSGTKPLKGALAALQSGTGDCEERSSLFVAMCRLKMIPARCVWIDQHTYPEFYLVDDTGTGHWIPCESLGARNFGGVQHVAPLLQKGDNFRMSQKEGPQRYVTPTCSGMLSRDSGQPVIREIRERLDAQ